MLNIEVFDLERSHSVSVDDDDIFSYKATCLFLITLCISSCSNNVIYYTNGAQIHVSEGMVRNVTVMKYEENG